MEKDRIIVVNEHDEIIGHKERGTITGTDIYRVSALWLTNSRGEILLAKRSRTKSHNPGVWGPAVGGTVEEGETYESNIAKESEEEIGLHGMQCNKGPKWLRKGEWFHFTQWFFASIDQPAEQFIIQEEEVEEVKWFSKEEITKGLEDNPKEFHHRVSEWVKEFMQ